MPGLEKNIEFVVTMLLCIIFVDLIGMEAQKEFQVLSYSDNDFITASKSFYCIYIMIKNREFNCGIQQVCLSQCFSRGKKTIFCAPESSFEALHIATDIFFPGVLCSCTTFCA